MPDYPLHPANAKLLKIYSQNLGSTLLIEAPQSSILKVALDYLLEQIYNQQLHTGNLLYMPQTEQQNYKIEDIRQYLQTLIKTPFKSDLPRLVVIERAETLNMVSQTALLKNLEEPSLRTHFILLTTQINLMLATIKSRSQIIKIQPPLKKDLVELWPQIKPLDFDKAYLAAEGWPNLINDYLHHKNSDISQQIALAKEFLNLKSTAQKLSYLLGSARPLAKLELKQFLSLLLEGLGRTSRGVLLNVNSHINPDQIKQWWQIFSKVTILKQDLDQRVSPKIITLSLSCLGL